jgi:hypothetical protein
MKYFTALPLVAGLAFAQEMMVMSLAPQASSGPMTHTVSCRPSQTTHPS